MHFSDASAGIQRYQHWINISVVQPQREENLIFDFRISDCHGNKNISIWKCKKMKYKKNVI